MIDAFMLSPSLCAMMRATASVPAPGGKGTTTRMVLVGYAPGCALVEAWNKPGSRVDTTSETMRSVRRMRVGG